MIWYDIFVNCSWVVTRWQYTFTHKQYRTTQITNNVEQCGPCPFFASFTLAFALQLGKSTENLSQGKRNVSQGKKNLSQINKNFRQCTVYILPKHTHIHTYTHITKQYKTTTVQIKTNTVQDIFKSRRDGSLVATVTHMHTFSISTQESGVYHLLLRTFEVGIKFLASACLLTIP
jgi:hypothetical protein